MESIARVRGRLDGGGWVSLLNLEDGVTWASPIQLGAYEIAQDTAVFESPDADAEQIMIRPQLPKGGYVNIVDVRVLEDIARVRGLLADGGWISLVSLEDGNKVWAVPVRLGAYEITYEGTVVGSDIQNSGVITRLQKGQMVQVAEVKVSEAIARVRGRLATGGWISLVKLDTGEKSWASPVPLGAYEIVHDATVHESENMDSEVLTTLRKGRYAHVVETKLMENIKRLRGKLDGGGWISLANLETGEKTWATPVPMGVHEIIHDATVNDTAELSSHKVTVLKKGRYVEVVEVRILESIARVRAMLADGSGWISLVNLDTGDKMWATPMQLGAYKITRDSILTESVSTDSETKVASLQKGQYVHVTEVKVMDDIARVRGRLACGGWMSLVSLDKGNKTWATPVQIGAYEIMHDTIVTESLSTNSRTVTSLPKGQYVHVTEAVTNDGVARVRGNVRGGGWLSLVNLDRAEKTWPEPVQLGAYEIKDDDDASIKVTETENANSPVIAILFKGQYVNVMEATIMHDESGARVRGRLDAGGWASLVNLDIGQKTWLTPVALGVYKVLREANVTEGEEEDSFPATTLRAGQYAHVVETKVMDDMTRLRGRLVGGGWLSIVNLENGEETASYLSKP